MANIEDCPGFETFGADVKAARNAKHLLEEEEVLECLSEHTFFETAKMLYVPAALLDYKFSLLHEKGELVNSMYIRKADFLKEDLHAYDNDIGYGDI